MQVGFQEDLLTMDLFNTFPEPVIWFRPITLNGKNVTDFVAAYCNPAACIFFRAVKGEIIGQRVLTGSLISNEQKASLFKQCLDVWETGKPIEETYQEEYSQPFVTILKSRVMGGVISITRDRTEYFAAERDRQEQATNFLHILDASADGVMLLEAIRDHQNEVTDFRLTHCNHAAFGMARISREAVGKTLLQILPHLKHSEQFELHKKVIEKGKPLRIETTFRNEKGEEYGWFIVSLMKMGERVVSTFIDISEKKAHEEKIKEQSDLLNTIFEASINAIFACDAVRNSAGDIVDLRVVKINSAFTNLLGIGAGAAEGTSYLELFPQAKEFGFFGYYVAVIETGVSNRKDLYYNDGKVKGWYDVSAVKRGSNGIVITFTDITESKLDKEALEEAALKLCSVINNSQTGMFTLIPIYEATGQIVDFRFGIVNQTVATYIGERAEKLAGSIASKYFPAYKTNGLFNIYRDTYLTNTPHLFDFHYRDTINVYFNIHTVKAGDEVLVTFTDHTSLKRLQLQLEASVEELKHSNANLEEFAYAASHDLQEPLRKIHYFSQRLRKVITQKLSEEEITMFERIENASKRMSLLIHDLLVYSQITVKTDAFKMVPLAEVISQVVADFESAISEKKATVTIGEMPGIKGDPVQLAQLFQNLLSNSLKYSKPGEAPIISITAGIVLKGGKGSSKPFHEIVIKDNGIGFEQEHVERIFKIFHRLHGQNDFPGTGIGLAIVAKVIDNHNGFIRAEGQPGEGAAFIIWLPVAN